MQHAAFAALEIQGLPQGTHAAPSGKKAAPQPRGGRLEVKREKSGRGGKTVTVIYAFPGMALSMKESILRSLKRQLATGGTLADGNIEIQGDFAERVVELLSEQGYRAIRAGG